MFYEFLGDGYIVKPENEIFEKIPKNGKYFKNIQLG